MHNYLPSPYCCAVARYKLGANVLRQKQSAHLVFNVRTLTGEFCIFCEDGDERIILSNNDEEVRHQFGSAESQVLSQQGRI